MALALAGWQLVAFPTVPNLPIGDVVGYREFMRVQLEPWIKQAWAAIIDPQSRVVDRDPVTGVVNSVTVTPLHVGWFRVQPLRTALNQKKAIDSTTTRTHQFWPLDFPADESLPDIKPGFEIIVMDGGNDPYLELYKYVVTGSSNSSMAWNRTIETVVNLESRPDYDTTGWPPKPGA